MYYVARVYLVPAAFPKTWKQISHSPALTYSHFQFSGLRTFPPFSAPSIVGNPSLPPQRRWPAYLGSLLFLSGGFMHRGGATVF